MAFPELFEWYDIAVKDSQSEQKKAADERKKAADERKKAQELANSRSRGHRR
jgi:hypothetical protein